jgi:hypothetical protein
MTARPGLRRRLAAAERTVGAETGAPAFAEMQAPVARTAAPARARVQAWLETGAPPAPDPAPTPKVGADAVTMARYCAAHGIVADAATTAAIARRLERLVAAEPVRPRVGSAC